ncbi:TPA: Type 1 glutamine amidotransferase-like domain-containing protein [Corynebacterium striatum]|nr:Type 1 glutamine amidotransferase-like domain-containing protein [Corynebacterium striatum]
MKLFLASFLHPRLSEFLHGRIVFIDDAASAMSEAPFAREERHAIADLASEFVPLTVAETPVDEFKQQLDRADCVYVAGGETFSLLYALKSSGAFDVLVTAIRGGLPYAGSSAGAVIAGPSIEPISVMDDPGTAPALKDFAGLSLTPHVVVPHAQGTTGPYSIEVISGTVEKYGENWNLLLLRDGQALVVDGDCDGLM